MKRPFLYLQNKLYRAESEMSGRTKQEIRKRKKSFWVLLLVFILFMGIPELSAQAAVRSLSIREDIGIRLAPGDTVYYTYFPNMAMNVQYKVGNQTETDNNFTYERRGDDSPSDSSGGGYTHIVRTLSQLGINASGELDYWELTNWNWSTNDNRINGFTLVAHLKNTVSKNKVSRQKASDAVSDVLPVEPEIPEDDLPPHEHHYEWVHTVEATEDNDGEYAYRCECGDVLYTQPDSAAGAFIRNTIDKINKAATGSTVKIVTSRWLVFNRSVCDALSKRPDVTLELSYLDGGHTGNRYITTIPAGTDLSAYADDKGFVGFLYLKTQFDTVHGDR